MVERTPESISHVDGSTLDFLHPAEIARGLRRGKIRLTSSPALRPHQSQAEIDGWLQDCERQLAAAFEQAAQEGDD